MFWMFSSRHWSTLWCSNLQNLADGKSIKSCTIYLTKNKISHASQTVATVQSHPKSASLQQCSRMYSECSRFHPNLFTFSGVTAECVNTAKSPGKVNPKYSQSLASSWIIITAIISKMLCTNSTQRKWWN